MADTDILADYSEWRSQQEERIGTHSDRCHMWPRHERCMIHRLAAEVERLRELADKRGSIAVKRRREIERLRLTDEERAAVEAAIAYMAPVGNYDSRVQATLRGLLDRTLATHATPDEGSVQDGVI